MFGCNFRWALCSEEISVVHSVNLSHFISLLLELFFMYVVGLFIDIAEKLLFSIIDEWENFLQRIGRSGPTGDSDFQDSSSDLLELRFWASYRGQTLARTGTDVLVSIFLTAFRGVVIEGLGWVAPIYSCMSVMYLCKNLKNFKDFVEDYFLFL